MECPQKLAALPLGLGRQAPLRAWEGPPLTSGTLAVVVLHPWHAPCILTCVMGSSWELWLALTGLAALSLPASMNVALYAGVAGGVAAALVIIGIILYCCCCRDTGKAEDAEVARP